MVCAGLRVVVYIEDCPYPQCVGIGVRPQTNEAEILDGGPEMRCGQSPAPSSCRYARLYRPKGSIYSRPAGSKYMYLLLISMISG